MAIAPIINGVKAGRVVVYLRVSTKRQAKGEFRNQLNQIKSTYSGLAVTSDEVLYLKEVKSGFASPDKRFSGKLGTGLKALKRDPDSLMIVSSADRIARTAEIFERINDQGLGQRVIDASTGKSVQQIVEAGEHKRIEDASERNRKACAEGRSRYLQDGGKLGRNDFGKHAKAGTKKWRKKTAEILENVLLVVSRAVLRSRGTKLTHGQLAQVLDELEVRTAQGHKFTPARISELKRSHQIRWRDAEDSYHRKRRRVGQLVQNTLIECKRRRKWRGRRWHLDMLVRQPSNSIHSVSIKDAPLTKHHPEFDHLSHRLADAIGFRMAHSTASHHRVLCAN